MNLISEINLLSEDDLGQYICWEIASIIEKDRRRKGISPFLPGLNVQVTINNGKVVCVLINVCHRKDWTIDAVRKIIKEDLLKNWEQNFTTEDTRYIVNPAGSWTVGGRMGKTNFWKTLIYVESKSDDDIIINIPSLYPNSELTLPISKFPKYVLKFINSNSLPIKLYAYANIAVEDVDNLIFKNWEFPNEK